MHKLNRSLADYIVRTSEQDYLNYLSNGGKSESHPYFMSKKLLEELPEGALDAGLVTVSVTRYLVTSTKTDHELPRYKIPEFIKAVSLETIPEPGCGYTEFRNCGYHENDPEPLDPKDNDGYPTVQVKIENAEGEATLIAANSTRGVDLSITQII